MIVLGVDTSDRLCTAAISDSDTLIGMISFQSKDSHLKALIPTIDRLLKGVNIKIKDIDLFVVVQGPGLWSGIRIGVASVKCLAQSLNKEIIGINALDVFAQKFRFIDNLVYPIIDASKKQVHFSVYNCADDNPKRIADYNKKNIEELLIEADEKQKPSVIIGNAIYKHYDLVTAFNGKNLIISSPYMNQLDGSQILETGIRQYREQGADNTLELVPLYLQRSDAEKKLT